MFPGSVRGVKSTSGFRVIENRSLCKASFRAGDRGHWRETEGNASGRISRMKGRAERQALPPAFMRGEGHAVAGGVPRSGGESLLSHGFAVPALPRGEPRELRSDNRSFRTSPLKRRENLPDEGYSGTTSLAPRIYEGGGPRSGGGSPPQRRGKPPQSRLRRASSPKGRAKGTALR